MSTTLTRAFSNGCVFQRVSCVHFFFWAAELGGVRLGHPALRRSRLSPPLSAPAMIRAQADASASSAFLQPKSAHRELCPPLLGERSGGALGWPPTLSPPTLPPTLSSSSGYWLAHLSVCDLAPLSLPAVGKQKVVTAVILYLQHHPRSLTHRLAPYRCAPNFITGGRLRGLRAFDLEDTQSRRYCVDVASQGVSRCGWRVSLARSISLSSAGALSWRGGFATKTRAIVASIFS